MCPGECSLGLFIVEDAIPGLDQASHKQFRTNSCLKLVLCQCCLFAPLGQLLCCRHPLFVEVFGRKSNLIVPIDGPAVKGVIAEVLRVLELGENALVVNAGEVEGAYVAVAEGELQQVAGDMLGSSDV